MFTQQVKARDLTLLKHVIFKEEGDGQESVETENVQAKAESKAAVAKSKAAAPNRKKGVARKK